LRPLLIPCMEPKMEQQQEPFSWTPERIEVLTRDWCAGITVKEIARKLGNGVTPSACTGKLHRLGLTKKARPNIPTQVKPKAANAANYNPMVKDTPQQAAFKVLAEGGAWLKDFPSAEPNVAFMDLRHSTCHWPCTTTGSVTTHFCGKETAPGSSYCPEHKRISRAGMRKREDRASLVQVADGSGGVPAANVSVNCLARGGAGFQQQGNHPQ